MMVVSKALKSADLKVWMKAVLKVAMTVYPTASQLAVRLAGLLADE
jgi:hypothetical protein